MESIVNLISTDSSASEIADEIKNALFTKSAEKINAMRPSISSSLFDFDENESTESPE